MATPPDDLAGWLRGLPKAEVHVHLEGSLEPALVRAAAREAGRRDVEAAAAGMADAVESGGTAFPDPAAFLAFVDASCGVVGSEPQLEAAAYGVARRAADAGVRYVDLIVNPTHWPQWRGRLGRFLIALDRGFSMAAADGFPPVGLCISLDRSQTAEEAIELVHWIVEEGHPRVVALSVDGDEAATGRTGPRLATAFARARAGGLRCCAHAGESSGPEGVRDAIAYLGAERVDHGIRAIEDPELVHLLAAEGIPLDVCPTSNVRLGVTSSLAAHPVDALRRAGVRVSLNTDDPVPLATSLDDEYHRCAATFGWSMEALGAVARTSIESSFADPGLRQDLLRDLDRYLRLSGEADARAG